MTRCTLVSLALFAAFSVVGCDPNTGGPNDGNPADCLAPQSICDEECVDLDTDGLNCGACGRACASGEFCSGGDCVGNCPEGTRSCDGSCVDVSSDRAHCGSCGNACSDDETCSNGGCQCPDGQTRCNDVCTAIENDKENCGLCGRVCNDESICSNSSCVCATGTRESNCGNNADDDCDALIDCADPDCVGESRTCTDPRCGMGQQTCAAGGVWGTCVGGSGTAEICGDGIDQDCDGHDQRLADEFEMNDSCDTARAIGETDPDLTINASFDSTEDADDYFKISVTDSWYAGESIDVDVDRIPASHNYDVYLYRNLTSCRANSALDYSDEAGNADESLKWYEDVGDDDTGTFYVRVHRVRGSSCTQTYRLTVNGLRL